MIYRLKELKGDTIPVPQLVFSKLGIAEEYNVRVALYVLATGITDPDKLCADLKLRSRMTAESALSFWAGAGLLDRYEDCPRYYYKKQFQLPVWTLNGNRMKKAKPCIAYVMHEDRRLGCPDAEYFELLRGGYSDWEFPLDTLKRGLAASIGRAEAIRYLKKRQMM